MLPIGPEFCHWSVEAKQTNEHGCVPIIPYSQKQVADRLWPADCSLLTPALVYYSVVGSYQTGDTNIPVLGLFIHQLGQVT